MVTDGEKTVKDKREMPLTLFYYYRKPSNSF
jgi:hypothetical protein